MNVEEALDALDSPRPLLRSEVRKILDSVRKTAFDEAEFLFNGEAAGAGE